MSLTEYSLLASSSLFVVVDPIAVVPAFIAMTPLGVPMLAGPGAISTALILMSQARGWEQHVALFGCIAVVLLASYVIFRLAVHGARRLSPLALKLVTRLMGLLLAAVSVQFALNGLAQTPLFSK